MRALQGPLANLLLIGPTQLPRFAANAEGGDLLEAVNTVFRAGCNIVALGNISGQSKACLLSPMKGKSETDPLNRRRALTLAELFLYLFDEALSHASALTDKDFIPQSDFEVNSAMSTTTTSRRSCPTGENSPACPDADCRGQNPKATCTQSGPKSKFSCAPLLTPCVNTVHFAWLFAQQTTSSSMVSLANNQPPPKPTPSCNNEGSAHLQSD